MNTSSWYGDLDNVNLHHDNAPSHTAQETQLTNNVMGLQQLSHPPYFPCVAPCECALFPQLKEKLRRIRFEDLPELRHTYDRLLSELSKEWFKDTFRQWVNERCVAENGSYFEKE